MGKNCLRHHPENEDDHPDGWKPIVKTDNDRPVGWKPIVEIDNDHPVGWMPIVKTDNGHPVAGMPYVEIDSDHPGIWRANGRVFTVFRLLTGPVRLGCLVSLLALYLPILFASSWAIRRERQ